MMKTRFNGPEQALAILQNLSEEERARILADIAKQDPTLAGYLQKHVIKFEDLIHLTPQMIQTLLKEVTPPQLGLALRGSSDALVEHITTNVSRWIKEDLLYNYNSGPKPLSEVREARDSIMAKVRQLIEKGQIVIDPSGKSTLV